MKSIATFTFVLLLLLQSASAAAQTARGSCTGIITVSDIPPYAAVFIGVPYRDCRDGSGYYAGCDEDGHPACCRELPQNNYPTLHRLWLEKLQEDGSWLQVRGPQVNPAFNNVEKGSYRVKCQVPAIAENICAKDEAGNVVKSRICVFNTIGQFRGYWGTWDNSPFGGPQITYTNTVVVGATTASDISYTFIDPTPNDPFENGYDFGELVKMNAAASKDYDLWWLAIFESGPSFNRYRSNGWTNGRMPNDEFDLTEFWDRGQGWEFEVFHSYTVQFAIENFACRNGIEQNPPTTWNNLDRSFFICPAGTGCRTGGDQQNVVISPNPASTSIRLLNFEPDLDRGYQMAFSDMTGRLVKSVILVGNEVDISELPGGMYVLNVQREGRPLFTSKLVINR